MFLKIIAMNQTSFSGDIEKLTISTETGEITILPGHQPITSIVVPGMVSIIPSQMPETGYIIQQ
jgi:F0F1-type ATP synthase epsilon subunit